MRKLAPPTAALAIRRMTMADLPRVMEIENQAFRHPWSQELLQRELTHEWSTIFVAEGEGAGGQRTVVGFSIFWIVHDELHVLNVATAPEVRRRGVARSVLQATLDHARARRCTLATLEVRKSNVAAQALYDAFGFKAVGIRSNYYSEDREDAVVMVLDL